MSKLNVILLVMIGGFQPVWGDACEIQPLRIQGNSLAPRIANGAVMMAEIGDDCAFVPRRGEIVLFSSGSSRLPLAKEVVAIPGDSWSVSADGYVFVGDALARNTLGFPYKLAPERARMLDLYVDSYDGVIPPDTYLLMGEPKGGSLDSSRLGLVHRDDIIGRVLE